MAEPSSDYSQHLDGSFYMNPRTGQIIDSDTGQVFQNGEELMGHANASSMENQGAQGGSDTAGQAAGVGGSLGSAYLMQSLLSGGTPAAATGTGAAAATGATAAETGIGAAAAAPVASGGGTLTIAAGAQVPAGYTAVGTAANGGTMIAPSAAGTIPAAALWAAPAAATAWGASSALDTMKKGQKEGTFDSFKHSNNSLKDIGKIISTGGLSLYGDAAGALLGGFATGKDKDQQERDSYRKNMRDFGFFNQAGADPESDSPVDPSQPWLKRLRSGAELDFGKDGGARLQNAGENIDGKTDRRFHDVDFSQMNSGELAAALNPLALAYGGGKEKGQRDEAGYLVNLVQQKGDPWDNVAELYEDADYNSLRELINESDLEQDKKDAAFNTIDDVYGVNAYAGKGTAWDRKGLSDKAPTAGQKPQQPKPVTSTPAPAATMGTSTSPGQIAPRPVPQLAGRPAPGGSVAPQQTGQPMRRVVMAQPKEKQIYNIFKRAHG